MNSMLKMPKVSAPIAQFLLRVPVSILFLQQGFSKLPITDENPYGLPFIVWWFVTLGEIGAGIGIIVGGDFGSQIFYWFRRYNYSIFGYHHGLHRYWSNLDKLSCRSHHSTTL